MTITSLPPPGSAPASSTSATDDSAAPTAVEPGSDAASAVPSASRDEFTDTSGSSVDSTGTLATTTGTPPEREELFNAPETLLEKAKDPVFMGEDQYVTGQVSTAGLLRQDGVRDALYGSKDRDRNLNHLMTGKLGNLFAARFLDRPYRIAEMCDFHAARGDSAFRAWMRAEQRLADVPQGELGAQLSGAFLKELRDLVASGRRNAMGWAVGGGAALSRPAQEKLEAALGELRASLALPDADPFKVVARFQKAFLAAVPGTDGWPEVMRLVTDRALGEWGVPPPIMRSFDVAGLAEDELAREIAAGSARMKSQAGSGAPLGTSGLSSGGGSAYHYGQAALKEFGHPTTRPVPSSPVRLDGVFYCLGPDGFAYDMFGRPHLVNDLGQLEPLTQVFYYTAIRRLAQSPRADELLDQLTARTRRTFYGLAGAGVPGSTLFVDAIEDPALRTLARELAALGSAGLVTLARVDAAIAAEEASAAAPSPDGTPSPVAPTERLIQLRALKALVETWPGPSVTRPQVISSEAAAAADARYAILLPRVDPKLLVGMLDLSAVPATRLFLPNNNSSQHSTKASWCMSSYAHLDNDFWHLQKAYEQAGDRAGASAVKEHRRELFDQARKHLMEFCKNDSQVTPENPLGFVEQFEVLMYERSPLRFESLDKAIAAEGDDTMVVWHGGTAFIQFMGLHPNDQIRNDDGFELSAELARRGVTRNLFAALGALSGTARGKPEMCTTTELGLLVPKSGFAGKTVSGTINLKALPGPLKEALQRRLDTEGEQLSIRELGDVLRLAAGTYQATPVGQVDVGGLSPEVVREALSDLSISAPYVAGQPQDPNFKQRVVDALASAAEAAGRRGGGPFQGLLRGDHTFVDLTELFPKPADGSTRTSDAAIRTIQTALNHARDLITFRRGADADSLTVVLHRRAFAIRIPKEGAMTSISFFGTGGFESEQEIHNLREVWPNAVEEVFPREELARPLGNLTVDQLGQFQLRRLGIKANNPGPTSTSTPPATP